MRLFRCLSVRFYSMSEAVAPPTGRVKDILEFWFGAAHVADHTQPIPEETKVKWWKSTPELDQEIKDRFEGDVNRLKSGDGEFDSWKQTGTGSLAIILLADQFTRNIYRGKAEAFSLDPLAAQVAVESYEKNLHKQLSTTMRCFMFMPFQHAESCDMQEKSVQVFTELAQEDESQAGFIQFAVAHKKIIDRFGRYPHRNQCLGRECTAEELEYLKDAPRFGQ